MSNKFITTSPKLKKAAKIAMYPDLDLSLTSLCSRLATNDFRSNKKRNISMKNTLSSTRMEKITAISFDIIIFIWFNLFTQGIGRPTVIPRPKVIRIM